MPPIVKTGSTAQGAKRSNVQNAMGARHLGILTRQTLIIELSSYFSLYKGFFKDKDKKPAVKSRENYLNIASTRGSMRFHVVDRVYHSIS